MTVFRYYDGTQLKEKEIDKDKPLQQLMVTVWSGDLNNRDEQGHPTQTDLEFYKGKTLQEVVNKFKEQYERFEPISFDWKGHSHGCLKFYWDDEQGREILTYVKLNYCGNEIIEFNTEELGF